MEHSFNVTIKFERGTLKPEDVARLLHDAIREQTTIEGIGVQSVHATRSADNDPPLEQ